MVYTVRLTRGSVFSFSAAPTAKEKASRTFESQSCAPRRSPPNCKARNLCPRWSPVTAKPYQSPQMKPKTDENKIAGLKFGCVNMFGAVSAKIHTEITEGRAYALVAER